ncbi:MAG: signal peptide peptidase SppA [Crocinitomicaceae bacterium]|nr:signal peptide peptidase SppA [Crocinitomicaceae bacterium]
MTKEKQNKEVSWFKKLFWPIFLSVGLSGLVFSIIFILSILGILSLFSEDPLELEPNTILHLKIDGPIKEVSNTELDPMSFSFNSQIGLSDILFGLDQAAKDKNVRGLFIDMGDIDCGMATAEELRSGISKFKKSGKFVLAYNSGEYVSQKAYYISSVANETYAFPNSVFEWKGLGGEVMFLKGLLDKLDVELEVIRGSDNDFKSAVEPFFRKSMSDSSRVQVERYLNSIWSVYLSDVSNSRNIAADTLSNYAELLSIRDAKDAVSFGLIDGTKYRDEIEQILMKKTKVTSVDDLVFFDFDKYCKKIFIENQELVDVSEPEIAVIVAEGDISVDGTGMSSSEVCEYFSKVRNNKNIKAVVFRVNSPGGSALASEEIWREVSLTNKKKPVIVSMGDLAASGGYYVSTAASRIFANPSTITGSIGVFGVIPYTGKMFENKLGIEFDYASTHSHSVFSLNKKLTEEELEITQEEVDEIYQLFLSRVAVGRKLEVEQVHKIARGRVWTGQDALDNGLIDELGGLNAAIAFARKKVGAKNDMLLYFPKVKENKLESFIEMLDEEESASAKSSGIRTHRYLNKISQTVMKAEYLKGIQMRLPYDIEID